MTRVIKPSQPSVSVVVPWGKTVGNIQRCIESILAQTYPIEKILVIVNGEVGQQFADSVLLEMNSNIITLVFIPGCSNANVARNIGVCLADTAYVAFIDSDDWWDECHIDSSLKSLKDMQCDLIYSGMTVHYDESKRPRVLAAGDYREYGLMESYLLSYMPAQTSSFVGRRECLLQCLWDAALRRHQDYEFLARFARKYSARHKDIVTVNVDWTKPTRSKNHLDCFTTLEKWKADISRDLYERHYFTLMRSAIRACDTVWIYKLPRALQILARRALFGGARRSVDAG